MDNKLSKQEQRVFNFVKNFIDENSYPPSVREIGKQVGFKSTSSVHYYLNKLKEKGYIEKKDELSRGIIIKDNDSESKYENNRSVIDVPILGNIAAGAPILAEQNIEGSFPIPEGFIKTSNELFMLNVKGDSMINAGILNNDYVLIKKQNDANNRDIVAALIDDEATVKTFYKEKDYFRLQPENDFYEPIIVRDNLQIIGKVVGVFRRL